MKLDEKWRQLVAESHAARKVLDEALAPVLNKLTAIGAGTPRENSTPEEDARLQAASEVLDEIHVRMKEFIAENTGTVADMIVVGIPVEQLRPRAASVMRQIE